MQVKALVRTLVFFSKMVSKRRDGSPKLFLRRRESYLRSGSDKLAESALIFCFFKC
jgi:hypothetical protein